MSERVKGAVPAPCRTAPHKLIFSAFIKAEIIYLHIMSKTSYNQKWINWNEQNQEQIDDLLSALPSILKENQMEWLADDDWIYNEDDGEMDEFFDLLEGIIVASIRFPERKKILKYMGTNKYDPKIEVILSRVDEELDRTALTEMEEELFEQLLDQFAPEMSGNKYEKCIYPKNILGRWERGLGSLVIAEDGNSFTTNGKYPTNPLWENKMFFWAVERFENEEHIHFRFDPTNPNVIFGNGCRWKRSIMIPGAPICE
jgi:hypothetical protein